MYDDDCELDFDMEDADSTVNTHERPGNPMARLFISQPLDNSGLVLAGKRNNGKTPTGSPYQGSPARPDAKRHCTTDGSFGGRSNFPRVLFPSPEAPPYFSRIVDGSENALRFQAMEHHIGQNSPPDVMCASNHILGPFVEYSGSASVRSGTPNHVTMPEHPHFFIAGRDSPMNTTGPDCLTPPQHLFAKSSHSTPVHGAPTIPWPRSPDQVFHAAYSAAPKPTESHSSSPGTEFNRMSPLREVFYSPRPVFRFNHQRLTPFRSSKISATICSFKVN